MSSPSALVAPTVAAIVAVSPDREPALLKRAVASIMAQTCTPDIVVLVIDQPQPSDTTPRLTVDVVSTLCHPGDTTSASAAPEFVVLENSRTPRMSGTGCWNSAVMHLLEARKDVNPKAAFVAILDDDDEWEPRHLELCLGKVQQDPAAVWVVSGLRRVVAGEDGAEPVTREVQQPTVAQVVDRNEFFCGNPGVQGSNLFVRVDVLRAAGLFDEGLPSCTDRDLCLRLIEVILLADTPAMAVAVTGEVTVRHYADANRPRVTSDVELKRIGLSRFFHKHGAAMSSEVADRFFQRCRDRFGLSREDFIESGRPTATAVTAADVAVTASGSRLVLPAVAREYLEKNSVALGIAVAPPAVPAGSSRPDDAALVGIVASSANKVRGLVADLGNIERTNQQLAKITVVIFANGCEEAELRELASEFPDGFVHVVGWDSDHATIGGITAQYCSTLGLPAWEGGLFGPPGGEPAPVARLPIGIARTVLQAHMHHLAERGDATFTMALVLDDDKRLPPGFLNADFVRSCDRAALYVGRDCGAAPNTLANGLRGQLLDLCHWLQPPVAQNGADGTLRESLAVQATAAAARGPHDIYYDLSSSRSDHLETPLAAATLGSVDPTCPEPVLRAVHSVLRGVPLARPCLPPVTEEKTGQRGGCLLVFKSRFDVLRVPQLAPAVPTEKPELSFNLSRRSDSLWLKHVADGNAQCIAHPLLWVLHNLPEATDAAVTTLSPADLEGLPMAARRDALAEAVGAVLCRGPNGAAEYLAKRVVTMRCNNARCAILAKLACARIRNAFGTDCEGVVSATQCLLALTDPAAWESDVLEPLARPATADALTEWLAASAPEARDRFPDATQPIRDAAAVAAAVAITAPRDLRFVGRGCEGRVFHNLVDARVYKIFADPQDLSEEVLGSLAKHFDVRMIRHGHRTLLSYPYISGERYRGDETHGAALTRCMRHLRECNLVMLNVKPANIVVASRRRDGSEDEHQLHLIDFGRDWRRIRDDPDDTESADLFRSMCRRAYLSWSLGRLADTPAGEAELAAVMSLERTQRDALPQLGDGFRRFFQCCVGGGDDPTVDTTTFGPLPMPKPAHGSATRHAVIMKTCLMEHATVDATVRSIVRELSARRRFAVRVLLVDRTKREGVLRQHTRPDEEAFDAAVSTLLADGVISHVADFDGASAAGKQIAARVNRRVFDHDSEATHSQTGVPCVPLLWLLTDPPEYLAEVSPVILQIDSDICINPGSTSRDDDDALVARAEGIFNEVPGAVTTLALPIFDHAHDALRRYGRWGTIGSDGKPFRFEIRFSFVHRERFVAMLPLTVPPGEVVASDAGATLCRGWYRYFDASMRRRGRWSIRWCGAPSGGFFVHPPNSMKHDPLRYLLYADRLGARDDGGACRVRGEVAVGPGGHTQPTEKRHRDNRPPSERQWSEQAGAVDAMAKLPFSLAPPDVDTWRQTGPFAERGEDLIVVIYGRNAAHGTAMPCIESLHSQELPPYLVGGIGVVVVDFSSDDKFEDSVANSFAEARQQFPQRVSCIRWPRRVGAGQAVRHVLQHVCFNPLSVIVFLELGDVLLPGVLRKICDALFFEEGVRRMTTIAAAGPVVTTNASPAAAAASSRSPFEKLHAWPKFLFDELLRQEATESTSPSRNEDDDAVDDDDSVASWTSAIFQLAGASRVADFADPWCLRKTESSDAADLCNDGAKHLELSYGQLRKLLFGSVMQRCELPSHSAGERAEMFLFIRVRDPVDNSQLVVLTRFDDGDDVHNVPMRIHSECFTGDVFHSQRCDCGHQLETALALVKSEKRFILAYYRGHEGRGNGLDLKAAEYGEQDMKPHADHTELLVGVGGEPDARSYATGLRLIQAYFGVESVFLHTNNDAKVQAAKAVFGQDHVMKVPMPAVVNRFNKQYLVSKTETLGHGKELVACRLQNEVADFYFPPTAGFEADHRGEAAAQGVVPCRLAPEAASSAVAAAAEDVIAQGGGDTFATLCAALAYILQRCPFTNLAVASPSGSVSPPRLPCGGVCYDNNLFLAAVLLHIANRPGTSLFGRLRAVRVVAALTRFREERPESHLCQKRGLPVRPDHLCVVVALADRQQPSATDTLYLLDAGNGVPYLTPLRVSPSTVTVHGAEPVVEDETTHGFLTYRVVPRCNADARAILVVEHRRRGREDWKGNYTVSEESLEHGCSLDDAKAIMAATVTDPNFGHMLRSLRINAWHPDGSGAAIRDTTGLVYAAAAAASDADDSLTTTVSLATHNDLIAFIERRFSEHAPALLDMLVAAAPTIAEYRRRITPSAGPPVPDALLGVLDSFAVER